MNLIKQIILFFVIVLLSVMSSFSCPNHSTIVIDNQDTFDNLTSLIQNELLNGRTKIKVNFAPGLYRYHSEHLVLSGLDYPEVSIIFCGHRAVILSDGDDLSQKGSVFEYVPGATYVDANLADRPNFSKVYQMSEMVEVIDAKKKICRVKSPVSRGLDGIDYSCSQIEITSWYTSYSCPIVDIKEGFIYFKCDALTKGLSPYGNYNINYDYTVGKRFPRIRLVNVPLDDCPIASTKDGLELRLGIALHQCEASRFIHFSKCHFKSLSFSEFRFVGCAANRSFMLYEDLSVTELKILKCEFSSIRSLVINLKATSNVEICENVFYDNYSNVISIANTSDSVRVRKNKFYRNGKSLKNDKCIYCRGGDFEVSHNEIVDFNYCAIGAGIWYTDIDKNRPCFGVIENNHIYYTDSYRANKHLWTLIDSGAIYVSTINNGTIIRNNYIHDYTGMGSNRGIYCDEGTNNCTICGNIILDIENSSSISLRRSFSLDRMNVGILANVNNKIFGNVFNNRFRYEGRENDTSSIKGCNTILVQPNEETPSITINNVLESEPDIYLDYNSKYWRKRGQRLVR